MDRADGGVELRLPRLLGAFGGAWIGAEAGQGWIESRSAHVQLLGRAGSRVRLLARGSATASRFTSTPEPTPYGAEADGYLRLDAAAASWLRLGARALVRVPLIVQGERAANPTTGLVVGLDATGVF
jgi:hypothetical protein